MSGRSPVPPADKLFFERKMLDRGADTIAGADEAGRGPLAGPVVCAAVILPLDAPSLIAGVDDSKKLKAAERERLAALIRARAVSYAICEVDNRTIDRINILEASKLCMKRAAEALSPAPDVLFTDGNFRIDVPFPQQNIVKGDALSYSVGAASILAKVYRDRRMEELDKLYPQYGFVAHKGYGTAAHCRAILEYGPCEIHRATFIKKLLAGAGKGAPHST